MITITPDEAQTLPIGSIIHAYSDGMKDVLRKTEEGWVDTDLDFVVSPVIVENADKIVHVY